MMNLSVTKRLFQDRGIFPVLVALSMLAANGAAMGQEVPPCRPVVCLTPTFFSTSWQAGQRVITLTNCECDQTLNWLAAEDCDWADISPASGSLAPKESAKVTVSYAYNIDCGERNCDITIEAPGAIGSPTTVKVTQNGNTVPDVCVSPSVRDVGPAAGTARFELWNWSCVKLNWAATPSCDWIESIEPPSDELDQDERQFILVRFRENKTCDDRSCRINLGVGGAFGVINQKGAEVGNLDVSPFELNASSASGETQFTIENSGCIPISWTSSYQCPWVSVAPLNGSLEGGESAALSVSYTANTTCAERICQITFSSPEAGNSPRTVKITQAEGGSARLEVSPTQLGVGGETGWASFVVTNSACSAMSWSATETCDWVSSLVPARGELAAKESTAVSVFHAANTTSASRTCSIRVDAPNGGGPKNVLLTQQPRSGAALLVEPAGRSVGPAAGSFIFTVSNAGFGSLTWSAQAPCAWIAAISPSSGTLAGGQSAVVTVDHTAHSGSAMRTCEISVLAPGIAGSPRTFTVTQTADVGNPSLAVSPGTRFVGSGQNTTSITVTNSGGGTMDWSASASCAWISSVNPSSGSLTKGNSATLNVVCDANSSPNARTCTLQVTAPGVAGSPKSVAVTQSGNDTPAIEISPAGLNTDAKAGLATFNVINSGGGTLNWTASPSASWVSGLSPSSGTLASGQGIAVMLSYESNTGGPVRTCSINVEAPGATGSPLSLTISQAGNDTPVLSVVPAALQAEQAAATRDFTVTNSGFGTMEWSVTVDGDWVTQLEPAAGSLAASESATVTVTYLANEAAAERNCTLTVAAPGASNASATVTLTQPGVVTPEPACGCPFDSFKGDWQSFFRKYLGDLLLLSVSIVLVLGLNRFRRE